MPATGAANLTTRAIVDANPYLVLATADGTGRPWSSPVYFAHERTRSSSGSPRRTPPTRRRSSTHLRLRIDLG
jgi:hypothetical protein